MGGKPTIIKTTIYCFLVPIILNESNYIPNREKKIQVSTNIKTTESGLNIVNANILTDNPTEYDMHEGEEFEIITYGPYVLGRYNGTYINEVQSVSEGGSGRSSFRTFRVSPGNYAIFTWYH